MFYLVVLLIVTVFTFFMVFNLNKQDIMSPSVMVCLVFIFSISIALYNTNKWNINYSFEAFAILSLGIFLFGFTDILVSNTCKKNRIVAEKSFEPVHIEQWKLIVISILDVGVVFLVLREVRRIAATNPYFANIFYAYRVITSHSENLRPEQYMNGIVNHSMKIVIVSGFICAVFFIYNVFICRDKLRKNIILLISPIMLCLMTLFTGVRTNILRLCVFCLICSYILLQYKKNWKIMTSWRFIRVLTISLVLILIIFGVLQSLLGRNGGSTDIISVVSNYAGASIVHFNQFIQNPPEPNKVFGQETFTGIWNVLYKLGFTAQSYKAHEEYRYITTKDFGNVYTLFRRFIQDFGIFAMGIMTMFLSAIFSYIYNVKIKYHTLTYKRWIIIIEYGYLYYIIAMASIDNLVHDYLNIGTILLVILLHFMLWFLLQFKICCGAKFRIRKIAR